MARAAKLPASDPSSRSQGRSYAQLLMSPGQSGPNLVGLYGIVIGVVCYLMFAGYASQLVLWLYWLIAGSGSFADFRTAAGGFGTPAGMLAANLSIALLVVVAALLLRYLHLQPARLLLSVEQRVRWRWFALFGVLSTVIFAIHVALMPVRGEDLVWQPQAGFAGFLIVMVLTTPLQAIGEEVFFRGYLLQALGSMSRSPWLAIIASALFFAFFHGGQNLALFLSRFAFGLVAGWLVHRTGGLEAAVAAHVVNNLFAWTLAGATSSVAEVRAVDQVAWAQAFSDVLLFAIVTLVCTVVARRGRIQRLTTA